MAGNKKSFDQIMQEVAEEQKAKMEKEKAAGNTAASAPRKSFDQIMQEVAEEHGVTYLAATEVKTTEVKTPTMRELAEQAEREYQSYVGSNANIQARQTAFQQYNAEHKWDGLKNALANPLGGGSFGLSGLQTGAEVWDTKEQELKAKADYYKVQAQLEADNALMMADMAELESWSPEDRAALDLYTYNRLGSLGNITQTVSAISSGSGTQQGQAAIRAGQVNAAYEQLAKKYGADRVKKLAESYERYQNQQTAEEVTAAAKEAANGDGTKSGKWGAGALHSGLSVGANLVNAMIGPIGVLSELSHRTGQYSTLDPNNAGNILGTYAGAVRGQVAENISGDQYNEQGNKVSDGGWVRQGLSTVYEAGMSAADNLARIFISGGNEALSLGLAATGSFSQTVSQASAQGANPVQAVAMGIVDGGLEVLTEKVSLDNLFKQAAAGPKNIKQVLKEIFKSGAIEVSEEELSFLGSTIFEAAILREKSGYNLRVGELLSQGADYEMAVNTASRELLMEAVETAVQSFLSGGMMSGGAQVVSAYRTGKIGKSFADLNLDKGDIQDLIDSGLESNPDSESYQIAQEVQKQVSEGKTPSNYDLARLWQANTQAMAEEEAERAKNDTDLPAPDDITQQGQNVPQNGASVPGDAQSVIENGQNVTQNTQNVSAAPLSVAAQLRQEQNLNGGNINGTQQQLTGPAAAQLAGTAGTGAGTGLLSGGGQWNDGTGAGEPAGSLAGRAGQAAQRKQQLFEQQRAAVNRRNYFRSLPLPKISSADLGIQSGTDTKNIKAVPQEYWDAEMGQLAQRVYQETGKQVSYVLGPIQIRSADRSLRNVNGVVYGDQIVIRADHIRLSMEQIADHEAYHGRVDYFGDRLNQEIRRHIVETYSEEELRSVLIKYEDALRGVYNADDAQTGEDFEQLMNQILEEVFADAYAGINAFGAGADRFTSAVNEKMEQLGLGRYQSDEQANGVRETNGPPADIQGAKENTAEYGGERYSIDRTKDMDWQSQINGALRSDRGIRRNDTLVVDNTYPFLVSEGISDRYFAIPQRVVTKAKSGKDVSHSISDSKIRKLQEGMRTAPIVIHNPERNALVFVTSVKQGGLPVIVSFQKDSEFDGDLVHKATSIHIQIDMNALLENLPKEATVYVRNRNELGATVGVTNNLRSLAASIKFIDDIVAPKSRNVKNQQKDILEMTDEEFQERYGLKLRAVDEVEAGADSQTFGEEQDSKKSRESFSVDEADNQAAIGDLQMELYQLQHQRRSILEADAGYAAAAENLRYANTFTEKVAARKAMAAASANIDTTDIDQRIATLNDQISEIRTRETRQHREDQEKYSGTKTAGYSTMPDTRLRDLDQDYMKAVRSGDLAQMEKMVERAAEAAMPASVVRDKSGRLLKTYHHTGNTFTVFDRNMARTGTEMDGFFFAPDPDSTSEYGSNMITAYLNITKLAMDPKLDRKFNDSGTLLREKLAYQGYDGMARTENGEIYEYMTFDPEQIKSADPVVYDDRGRVVPLSERFNFHNSDIRYSVDDSDTTDFASVQAAMNAQSKEWGEMYLRDQLGDEGYEKYRAWEKQQAEQKKQQSKEQAKQRAAEKQAVRNAVTKPVAESRPIVAKRELRNTMMNIFSIPEGSRAELGTMIDNYADRLIKNGELTEQDRKHFFDRMYDAGVMTVPKDDYFSEGRDLVMGGRVYVPESVRADFGDDWNDIRRRAFGSRIYFTSDPGAGGIDSWNQELAEQLPGLFDAEETDMRSILERIVEIAEEGKDEKMSLAQYTAMLAEQNYVNEDEFLDSMERQMDWALRSFAEKARLEVSLRDRTGVQIAKERAEHQEMQRRQRDRKELRELQEKTLKSLRWLNQNRNRAPEELREEFEKVLGDIDLYAIGAANEMRWSDRYNATWKDLAQMYKDAMTNDPNFLPSKELEMIVARLDGAKIEDMDLGALNDLYKAAIGLRTEFHNRNNVISDEMQRLFEEVYTDAKQEIESAPGKYTGKQMEKFLNLDQLTPMNVLQRMGGWDPNGAFYSMAKQLEKGERDMRAYSVRAQRMLLDFLTEHADWVKKADGQGKDGIWYEVQIPELIALEVGKKPEFGSNITVHMTPAQKVHMYLESKNVDNLRHMTGGRTFADKKLYSEGKRQEALAQGKTVRMAPETVKAIVSDLTAEEIELARLLEQYYNSFATQEINRISNILYGYDKAMGKNYAPIYTNRNYTKAEFGVFDTTAEGVGNLKGRQYAVNPSYNISAFDAFERHVDQTARFVGMAIPARNWTTLMNWRVKNNSTGDVITHKWGEEGKRYITDLITTLQAGEDGKTDTVSSTISKLQSTYITSIFGANPSIVLKQLGSIPLASAYLDAQNVPKPAQIKSIDRELIGKYTQDLAWRIMGYSMPETKQLKENPNWTQTNKFYQFTFGGGAITAMDGWAASVLWPWAENKVRRDFPELELGTQEQIQNGESPFYKKVAEFFEDAVARSQSTSDEIHQSSLRKSKNPITRAFTMFRSDSAQTYNVLRQKIGEAQYYARTGATAKVQMAAKQAVGAAFISLLMNAMWSEAINFLMALWKNKGKYYRDDEDELTFQSVAGEMVSGMLGSFAGIVTGGEELLEIIGNLLTGDKIYDIETPGIEQLNDVVTAVTTAGGSMREIIAGAADVAVNGGNVLKYFGDNSRDMLGCIKELAETVVMYIPNLPMSGLPASNIEAYLLGAVKWLSPELGAAYDDLFQSVGKSDLSGLEGDVLESRVDRILSGRNVSESEETVQTLAALYEAGYKTAVPSDTPTSVTIDGEKYTLGTYQKQAYETVWNGVVADALDDIVSSDAFTRADEEEQAKILKRLYDYAAERAKAELFENFEISSTTRRIDESRNAGLELAECIELEGAELDDYLEMVEGGLKSDLAYELTQELAELVPLPSEDEVQDVQEWRMCVEFSSNVGVQLAALCGRMSDKQFAKVKMAYDFGINPDSYVAYYEIREQYDEDGNGSFTNAEVKAAVDSISGLDTQQRAALWQIVTGNTSAKNNPYDRETGQKVLDAKAAEKG